MKRYLFSVVIVFLVFAASYLFYTLWHSEETVSVDTSSQERKATVSQHPQRPKYTKQSVPGTSISVEPVQTDRDDPSEALGISALDTPPLPNDEQYSQKTKELYEALTPEEHEETMREAQEAFEALDDEIVPQIEERLLEEEENRNEIMDDLGNIEETDTVDPQGIEEDSPLTDSEEMDAQDEDVNNP
jgi:hypothetical protein